MDESLNQPSSVQDDGPMGCKLLLRGDNTLHVLEVCRYRANKDRLNSVPAAAVIRKVRALSGFIGFKGSVGREVSVL